MVVRVSPTEPDPTHHISLSDGVTTIGLCAVNNRGQRDATAIRRAPYRKSTLRFNPGNSNISEQQEPYGEFSRTTWIGGMGYEEAEANSTGYWFGKNVWTLADGRVLLAPKTLGTPALGGLSNTGAADSNTSIWYYNKVFQFKVIASGKIGTLTLNLKCSGTVYIKFYTDSGGPATYLATYTLTTNDASNFKDYTININRAAGTYWIRIHGYSVSPAYIAMKSGAYTAQSGTIGSTTNILAKDITRSGSASGSSAFTRTWSGITIPSGKLYTINHIHFSASGGSGGYAFDITMTIKNSGVTAYSEKLTDIYYTTTYLSWYYPEFGEPGSYSVEWYIEPKNGYTVTIQDDGTVYGEDSAAKYITLSTTSCDSPIFTLEYSQESGGAQGEFFEYLGGLYYVTRPKTGQSKLFYNCDRGAADSNSGALTTLVDATKSWTTNIYAGAIVKIVSGPGAGEWRKVVSNTATTLTVDTAWETTHTTATNYVIIGLNLWTEISTATTGFNANYPCTDVCTSNQDIVYYAFGQSAVMIKMREYNSSGNWTREFDPETGYADLMCFDWDQTDGGVIWRASNVTPPTISRAPSIVWNTSTNLTFGTAIPIGDGSPIKGLIAYDGKIAVTKNNSVWLVKNNLPEKLSIDMGSQYEEFTGANPQVYTPYMIFPFGNGIERLYGQIVEDFTPDMPVSYSGQFSDSVSIPGAIIAARRGVKISGGANNSMILIWRNGAWHPFYSIDSTYQVFDVYYQRIDSGDDILWFSATTGILGIRFPREWDWLKDPAFTEGGYDVSSEGYLISGWNDGGSKRVPKWWEDIYLSMDAVGSGTGASIAVYYQTRRYQSDTDISAWTFAGALSASGKINLRVSSQEIRFRFVLTGSSTHVPILLGYNVEYLARIDAADEYSVPLVLSDEEYNLQGESDTLNAEDKQAILDRWSRGITPLTMRCVFSLFDNKRVLPDRPAIQPRELNPGLSADANQPREVYTETLILREAATE